MEAENVLDVPQTLLKQTKSQPVLLLGYSFQWLCAEMRNVVRSQVFELLKCFLKRVFKRYDKILLLMFNFNKWNMPRK